MKLKIILSTMFLSSLTYSSFAQFGQEKDNKSQWGFTAAINSTEAQMGDPLYDSWGYATGNYFRNFADKKDRSLSLSIIPKYFITNDILFRFEFGITNINLSSYFDGQSSSSQTSVSINNQTIQQKIYRYIPGIQWNFMKKKIIESYCGMSIAYLHYSVMNYHNHVEQRDLPNNTLTGGYDDIATGSGGFAGGMGAFAGFNIYLQKHISIGVEFSSSLLYYKIGDKFSGVSSDLINPNPSTTQTYSYTSTSYKGFQFSKALSSFNISVWL